jgi:hypothetical protein
LLFSLLGFFSKKSARVKKMAPSKISKNQMQPSARESFDLNLVEGKSAFSSTPAEVAEPPQVAPSVYRDLWQRCCIRGDHAGTDTPTHQTDPNP